MKGFVFPKIWPNRFMEYMNDDWPLKGPLTPLDPDRSPEDIAASIALDEAQAGPSPGLDEFLKD